MKKIAAAATATMLAVALSSCASAEPVDSTSPEKELMPLSVGFLPNVSASSFELAKQEGYFVEEGLDVEGKMLGNGSASIAALLAGDIQIGWSALNSTLTALSQNVPLLSVAPGSFDLGADAPVDEAATLLLVPEDSDIKSWDDLDGAVVAIAALESILHLHMLGALESRGIDPNSVTYAEIGLPDTGAAIEAGRVDAAIVPEPWSSILQGQGMRPLGNPSAFTDVIQSTEWVTSISIANENPEAIAAFQRAIAKANAYLSENPEKSRELVPAYITTLAPEVVAVVKLPMWQPEIDRNSYVEMRKLMLKYTSYTHDPDLDDYLRLTKK